MQPLLWPSLLPGRGTLMGEGARSPDDTGSPDHVFLPQKGKFALDCPEPLPTGQAAEPCIYVHTQCLSPASSISLPLHRPGTEKGHAKAGLTPPTECSTPPCRQASDPCVSSAPEAQGASRQKAGVGFALFCSLDSISLFASFSSGPRPSLGLGKRTDL